MSAFANQNAWRQKVVLSVSRLSTPLAGQLNPLNVLVWVLVPVLCVKKTRAQVARKLKLKFTKFSYSAVAERIVEYFLFCRKRKRIVVMQSNSLLSGDACMNTQEWYDCRFFWNLQRFRKNRIINFCRDIMVFYSFCAICICMCIYVQTLILHGLLSYWFLEITAKRSLSSLIWIRLYHSNSVI